MPNEGGEFLPARRSGLKQKILQAHEPPSLKSVWLLVGAAALVVGFISALSPVFGVIAVGAILVLMLLVVAPWIAVASVAPAAFITYRIGDVGSGLTVADMALFVGVLAAFILLPLRGAYLDRHFQIAFGYFLLLLLPLVANPTTRAVVEWGHRLLLVGGGLVIGATLVSLGQARQALKAFVWISVGVASIAILTSIFTGFQPVYPLGFSKNQTGGLLGGVLILVIVGAPYLGLSSAATAWSSLALALGLLATQSRGAMLALVVGVFYLAIRRALPGKRKLVVLVPVALAIVTFSVFTLRAETVQDEGNFSSVRSRIEFQQEALEFWYIEPFLGQGIRYYLEESVQFPRPITDEEPEGGTPHPHNVIVETLSESGIVGLFAFLFLVTGTLMVLGRRRSVLSLAAGAMVVMSVSHGLFDIYWLAGLQTVPWIIVGASAALDDSPQPLGAPNPDMPLSVEP